MPDPQHPSTNSVLDRPGELLAGVVLRAVDVVTGQGAIAAVRACLVAVVALHAVRGSLWMSEGDAVGVSVSVAQAVFTLTVVMPYLERVARRGRSQRGVVTAMDPDAYLVRIVGRVSTLVAVVMVLGVGNVAGAVTWVRSGLLVAACYVALDGGDGGGVSALDRARSTFVRFSLAWRPVPAEVRV